MVMVDGSILYIIIFDRIFAEIPDRVVRRVYLHEWLAPIPGQDHIIVGDRKHQQDIGRLADLEKYLCAD